MTILAVANATVSNAMIEQLFLVAQKMTSDDREELLASLSSDVRREVHSLLAASEAAEQADFLGEDGQPFLVPTAPEAEGQTTAASAANDALPTQIGPYKILQPIGQGGMGHVYMAEQTDPVKRRVALKVINTETPSKDVLARFEAERQALAMMNHQHIAKVLDVGITDSGRPYFAMELVKGVPITEFCDVNRLTPNERLGLFIQTCRAIQHAHTKGIVHRDIKPSNILVTQVDGKPIVKVIDFGLAKALQDTTQLTKRTLFTQYGQVVGTLAYMSPEQAEMNALDIDTRTDVYSLGVILYELLTGSTPLTRERIRKEAFDRLLAIIREEEAPRPSQRLSESPDAITGISEQRRTEPRRLSLILRGDLDWISMKALDKARSRRYDTAAALADDVQRYLDSEPIEARPPTVGYRLQKAIRKHKATFAATFVILLSLLAGLAGTGYMWLVARANADVAQKAEAKAVTERNVAREEKRKADNATRLAQYAEKAEREARQVASRERELARQQEAVAVAVRKFMQDDFLRQADTFEQANSGNEVKKNLTVVELVKRVAKNYGPSEIKKKFPNDPRVQAEVMATIAEISSGLGEHDTAIQFVDAVIETYQSLSNGEPITPEYQNAVLDKLFYQLNSKAFFELSSTVALYVGNLHKTLELTHDDFGDAAGTIDLDQEIDDRIDAIVEAAIRRSNPQNFVLPVLRIDPPINKLFSIAGELLPLFNQIPEIEKRLLQRYGADDRRIILGFWHVGALDYIVASLRRHADKNNMGFLLPQQFNRSFEQSIDKFEAVRDSLINEDDDQLRPMVAGMEILIAVVRHQNKSPQNDSKILEYYQSSLEFLQGHLQNHDHSALNLAKTNVANTLRILGRYSESYELYRDVTARRERVLGPNDPQTLGTLKELCHVLDKIAEEHQQNLAKYHLVSEERADQYQRLMEGLSIASQEEPDLVSDRRMSMMQDRAGTSYFDLGKFDLAVETLRASWGYRRDNLNADDNPAEYMTTLGLLAKAQEKAGQLDEALQSQLELCELRRKHLRPPSHAFQEFTTIRAAELLTAAGRDQEAKERLDELGIGALKQAQAHLEPNDEHSGLFHWERKKCGWDVADFAVDETSGSVMISYAPGLLHQRRLRLRESPEDHEEAARRLIADGWKQLKQERHSVEGQTLMTTLWGRPAPPVSANPAPPLEEE